MRSPTASNRQVHYIEALAGHAGYSHPGQAVRDALGKNPWRSMTWAQANKVIEFLRAKVRGPNRTVPEPGPVPEPTAVRRLTARRLRLLMELVERDLETAEGPRRRELEGFLQWARRRASSREDAGGISGG